MAKAKKQEDDKKPPRYMAAFVDFKTDVQLHVGAEKIEDFLKPYDEKDRRDLSEQVAHVFKRYNKRKITTKEAVAEVMGVMDTLPERFELERVIRYFTSKTEESERKAKAALKKGKKPKKKGRK